MEERIDMSVVRKLENTRFHLKLTTMSSLLYSFLYCEAVKIIMPRMTEKKGFGLKISIQLKSNRRPRTIK
jgi:hypothetical protein